MVDSRGRATRRGFVSSLARDAQGIRLFSFSSFFLFFLSLFFFSLLSCPSLVSPDSLHPGISKILSTQARR
jgi:hypothetical protein